MNSRLKMLAWPLGLALVIGLYFSENIWGYYRFKEICAKEGGLKVYQPLVKGVGWKTEKGLRTRPLAYFFAGFTRYSNEGGQLIDVRLVSGQKAKYFDKDFSESNADLSRQPSYEFRESYEKLTNETRLGATNTEVIDLETRKTLVIYKTFTYETFEQDKTLLGASSASTCPEHANFGPQDSNGQTTPGEKTLGIASTVK